jgi:hypothetical protein
MNSNAHTHCSALVQCTLACIAIVVAVALAQSMQQSTSNINKTAYAMAALTHYEKLVNAQCTALLLFVVCMKLKPCFVRHYVHMYSCSYYAA